MERQVCMSRFTHTHSLYLCNADFVDASLAYALFIVRTRLNVYVNGMFPVRLTGISTRGATLIPRVINSQSMNLRSSRITPKTSCCESDTMYCTCRLIYSKCTWVRLKRCSLCHSREDQLIEMSLWDTAGASCCHIMPIC